jgi:hypothetical protein
MSNNARTDLVARLAADLTRLPYAYHTKADVDAMVAALGTNPAWVYEELMSDVDCHEECWNQLKADHIRETAERVVALM